MPEPRAFDRIPLVDVSGLRGADPDRRAEAARALGDAARDVGFAYVVGHGIDPALFRQLVAASTRFFDLPHEEKMRTWIGRSTNHRGYVPPGEEVFAGQPPDRKEAFDTSRDLPADHPAIAAGTVGVAGSAGAVMLGPNQWPDLPGFRATVTAWYDAVLALGRTVFTGFALALGEPEDLFTRHVTVPPSQLRLLHYPADGSAEDRPGIGAHTDYEMFTLLRPTAPGLEVLNGSGEWIDVPLIEGAFVLNVGDLLELWTDGEFVATTHRVRRVTQERYAFPLFCTLDWETVVRPHPRHGGRDGLRDAEPSVRQPLVSGEHLWAQTVQTFTYLRDRLARGEIRLPDGAMPLSAFGARPAGVTGPRPGGGEEG
jgi:isopenicillin N synthase-like dioxygenase